MISPVVRRWECAAGWANEQGRFRVSGIDVDLSPKLTVGDAARLARCEALFEDFCVVTQSVREGIDVKVNVSRPSNG